MISCILTLILITMKGVTGNKDLNITKCAEGKDIVNITENGNFYVKCCSKTCCDACNTDVEFVLKSCERFSNETVCQLCRHGYISQGKTGSTVCHKACGIYQFSVGHDGSCANCSPCPEGYGAVKTCRVDRNTECGPCQEGYFSDDVSFKACLPCKVCPPGHTLFNCTMANNTVCLEKDDKRLTVFTSNKGPYWQKIFLGIIIPMSIMVVVFVVLIFYLWRRQNQKLPLRRLLGGVSVSECSEADVHIDASSHSSLDSSRLISRFKSGSVGEASYTSSSTRSSYCSDKQWIGLRQPSRKLNKMPFSVFQELGLKLNPPLPYKDWERLAGLLDFTVTEVENFRLSERKMFTENILFSFSTRRQATIGYLYDRLIEMDREDCAQVLLDYDKKAHSDNRVETPV